MKNNLVNLSKNKKILLCVSGGIAFYKAYEILRELKKLGFDVFVAMSENCFDFCTDTAFEALSGHKVLCKKNESWSDKIDHISYSKVDLAIIAPATANTINKIACGIADNVLLSAILACNAPKIIAPAANENMLQNPATIANLDILRKRKFIICEPKSKILACGDFGRGALADPENIVFTAIRTLNQNKFWQNKKVIITGGATTEKIDSVRAITNLSSGKMALSLAKAFYFMGAKVVFITSNEVNLPFESINFQNSFELLEAINTQKSADLLVMCAAVSDFVVANKFDGKIKKTSSNLLLELKENIDILKNIKIKCKKIGFKMEFDEKNALKNAKKMLNEKNLDAVCLNILGKSINFGSDETQIKFITKNNEITSDFAPKLQVALQITKLAQKI